MRRSLSVLSGVLLLVASSVGPATAAPPANDLPGGALAIPLPLPFAHGLDTTEATVTTDDVGCGAGGIDQASVWYTITSPDDLRVAVDSSASSYITGVNVFAGTPTPANLVFCAEGGLVFEAIAGTTYYLMIADIDDNGVNGGTLALVVDVAPPPPEVEFTVDSVGKVDPRSGTVTVSGTIECSADLSFGELFVIVRQPVGRVTISGGNFAPTGCTAGETTHWSVSVTGENGKFAGGRTTVEASFFGCGLFDCVDLFVSQSIRLRH